MATKTKSKKIGLRKSLLFYSIMIAWPILQFCVFYIGVNLNSVLLAFKDYGNSTTEYEINFNNFKRWLDFEDTMFGADIPDAFLVSIKAYLISLVVGVPLGLFFSYYIFKKLPASGFFRVVLFLPTIVSSIVLVTMYKYFANNVLSVLFEKWGLRPKDSDVLLDHSSTRFATMMVYNVFVSFGTSVLMYSNKMSTISPEIIESAQLDGAGAFKEFIYVVLPLAFSTVSVFLITGIAGIFTNQINAFAFFPNSTAYKDINSLGYLLYYKTKQAGSGKRYYEYSSLSALGLLFTLVAFPLTLFARYMFNRFGPSED